MVEPRGGGGRSGARARAAACSWWTRRWKVRANVRRKPDWNAGWQPRRRQRQTPRATSARTEAAAASRTIWRRSAPPIGQCVGICNQRAIIPTLPETATTNQQVMYALADGTGGFVIKDTNDLLGGMQKIGQEQDEYYILGYTPPDSPLGSCHVLKVKVDRGGTSVRARSGYCNVKSRDVLGGSPVEKTLETRAAAAQAGEIPATMQLPFFYTAPNVARVEVAMDIASKSLKFEKEKGKLHAAINVLGIANTAEGGVGARFSDTLNLDFEMKRKWKPSKKNRFTTKTSSTSRRASTI